MKRHGKMIVTYYGGIRFNASDYADATPEEFSADFTPAWADSVQCCRGIELDISFPRGLFYIHISRAKAIAARVRKRMNRK